MSFQQAIKDHVAKVADARKSDLYLFCAPVTESRADKLIADFRDLPAKREKAGLVMVTMGGSADAAFQIARYLQRTYKEFTLYVFGNCKSAGTLVAVGASEIVMSDCGQLGPLDVQLSDTKELFGQTAALDISEGLTVLANTARAMFFKNFFELDPGKVINTKTAADIAIALTGKVIEPIASQIDPLLLGRVDRSIRIAEAYSKRLAPNFKNIKHLVSDYPAHEFVIDIEEAGEIFPKVRAPDADELALEAALRRFKCVPSQKDYCLMLSEPIKPAETQAQPAAPAVE